MPHFLKLILIHVLVKPDVMSEGYVVL